MPIERIPHMVRAIGAHDIFPTRSRGALPHAGMASGRWPSRIMLWPITFCLPPFPCSYTTGAAWTDYGNLLLSGSEQDFFFGNHRLNGAPDLIISYADITQCAYEKGPGLPFPKIVLPTKNHGSCAFGILAFGTAARQNMQSACALFQSHLPASPVRRPSRGQTIEKAIFALDG